METVKITCRCKDCCYAEARQGYEDYCCRYWGDDVVGDTVVSAYDFCGHADQ